MSPFASLSSFSLTTTTINPPQFISINGNIVDDKVNLTWNVSENETADKFEVEKSTDGIHFSVVALVFGTDKVNTDLYQFFEKVADGKVHYRIKLITKNKELKYSTIIEINPGD